MHATQPYFVEYFTNGTCSGAAAGSTNQTGTSYNYTGLTNGTSYSVRVTSRDAVGNTGTAVCSNSVTKIASAALLTFDSPSQPSNIVYPNTQDTTFTVTNSGGTTATGMTISGLFSPYSQNGGTCGATLAASGTCTIIVRFSSPGQVTANGTLKISYNDGIAAAQSTKTLLATGLAMSATVAAVYSGNSNWNDYVRNNGTTPFNANNTACDGTETGALYKCIHGGEKRKVVITGVSSCSNLTAEDSLGAFDWICDASSGTATYYMVGLKAGKGLGDLISYPGGGSFKNNYITVWNGIYIAATSTAGAWWSNTISLLPDNHLSTDAVQTLSTAGSIYTLTTDYTSSGYNVDNNKIAIVAVRRTDGTTPVLGYSGRAALNCAQSTAETALADLKCLIAAGSQKFLWIEGVYDSEGGANDADYGIHLFSTVFSRIHLTTVKNGNSDAIHIHGSDYNTITNTKISNNNGYGALFIQYSNYNLVDGLTVANTGGIYASYVDSGSGHLFRNIKTYNNQQSPMQFSASDSIILNLVSNNNSQEGLGIWGGPTNNRLTVSHVTATNNPNNITLYRSRYNTYSQFALANSYWDGGLTVQWDASNNIFSQFAVANNGNNGISLFDAANNNQFTHNLLVGSNVGANCAIGVNTNPGLTAGACANQGTSNATIQTSLDLSNTFVGKVGTGGDYANSSDTDGTAAYSLSLDWLNFDNFFRGWGKNGSAFPSSDHVDFCGAGTCRIWDWRLRSTDTAIRNKSNNGSISNTAFVAGATCPAAVHGNYTLTDQQLPPHTYLVNAQEIMNDPIRNPSGNNNGLCESGEACIYSPNFGAYQGEGTLIGPCTFQNGTVTGVTMYAYSINGVGNPGTLDTTFGTSGEYNIASGASNDGQGFIIAQPDGKIITVGDGAAPQGVFTISRVLPDGGMDTSFNGGGSFNFSLGASVNLTPSAVVIQRDGKFIVGGRYDDGLAQLIIVRFNADGSTDTGFGDNGVVILNSGFPFGSIKALAVQADGKILAGGQWGISGGNTSASVFRFHPDGAIDTSFGTSGRSEILAPGGVRGMVVQPDGNILVTGENVTVHMFVARLLGSNGALDPSFNGTGVQTIAPLVYSGSSGHSIALQQDGKIIAAGIDQNWGVAGQILVARLNSNGSMDNTFGTSGKLGIDLPTVSYESINAVKVQSDGRILLAGDEAYRNWGGNDKVFVIRLLPGGGFDNTFGTNGVATFLSDTVVFSRIKSLEILSDGRILTGGCKIGSDIEILRLWQ